MKILQIIAGLLLTVLLVLPGFAIAADLSSSTESSTDTKEQTTHHAITQHSKELFNAKASPVLGNKSGDVTIVEFLDYRCPHCQTMGIVLDNLIKKDPKLRVIIKELPIFGKESQYAAKAALAAGKQNKFAELHNAFLNSHGSLDADKINELATSVGIQVKKLESDIKNPSLDQQLTNNIKLAQALQIEGTPAFIIRNRAGDKVLLIPGATSQENLESMIGQMRSGTKS